MKEVSVPDAKEEFIVFLKGMRCVVHLHAPWRVTGHHFTAAYSVNGEHSKAMRECEGV